MNMTEVSPITAAPVLVATLNRHEHFIRLIESLKANTWAKYTDVYIALDFPAHRGHEEGYHKICDYLNNDFSIFKSFNVIKRDVNYGSFKNMKELRDRIVSQYDCFIRTDDDAEFSPNFLEYMNKCLCEYKNDEDVIAVTGYSYPFKWKVSDGATIFKEGFICPMWGTGFWARKYREIERHLVEERVLQRKAREIVFNGGYKKMTNVCRAEFVDLCLSPEYPSTWAAMVTDVSMRMYMAAFDKHVIMPVISKVRNWGFDGTGEFCSESRDIGKQVNAKNYNYSQQRLDEQQGFVLLPDFLNVIEENKRLMNRYDLISFTQKLKMYVKLIIYMFLGKTIFTKITLFLRKIR